MPMPPRLRQTLRRVAPYVPAPITSAVRYPRESLFVRGWADFDKEQPSVVFFSMNKCASMLMLRIISLINKRSLGLTHLNLDSFLWDAASRGGERVSEHMAKNPAFYFRDRGILYGPIRDYVDVSHLREARVFAMLRDPRDVLVSYYFSQRYAHRPPSDRARRKAFYQRRAVARELSLDAYVLRFAPQLEPRYLAYRQNLSRAQVLTYEHMTRDLDGFLYALADAMETRFSPELLEEIRGLTHFQNSGKEDEKAYQRKGRPGDHREKLSPGVIEQLDDVFGDTLAWLYD